MFDLSILPTVNATLNGLAGMLLVAGFVSMRRGKIKVHRAFMLAAFTTSVLFLTSYLVYHFNFAFTRFPGVGLVRGIYFAILIPHVVLAATVVPLALITLSRGLRGRIPRHRRIARWTFPIWLYVSVTGVIVYVMLYRITW